MKTHSIAPRQGVFAKIVVLGTGMVGETISSKLVELGHEVRMGSRTADDEKPAEWVRNVGLKASHGTFAPEWVLNPHQELKSQRIQYRMKLYGLLNGRGFGLKLQTVTTGSRH